MNRRALLLGGSGKLGRELVRVLEADAPSSSEVDVRRQRPRAAPGLELTDEPLQRQTVAIVIILQLVQRQ